MSGYGYDEKYSRSGSMNLAEIDKALKDGGVTFDFVGFDACLMATAETALMVGDYADYMIASEEGRAGYRLVLHELADAAGAQHLPADRRPRQKDHRRFHGGLRAVLPRAEDDALDHRPGGIFRRGAEAADRLLLFGAKADGG